MCILILLPTPPFFGHFNENHNKEETISVIALWHQQGSRTKSAQLSLHVAITQGCGYLESDFEIPVLQQSNIKDFKKWLKIKDTFKMHKNREIKEDFK